jgi:subtilisin
MAMDRGYHILNCSFGCARVDHLASYKEWIDEAYLRGRHIVAASNNEDYTRREWPGHFPTVITVRFIRAEDPLALFYQRGQLVEFAAAGQELDVVWIGGARKTVTGSSFATPHVTGMLARILSCCPELPPLQAKALLQHLAAPLPA